MNKSMKSSCVLRNLPLVLTVDNIKYSYAQIWYTNPKGLLINTGVHIDTNDANTMAILRKYPYSFAPLDYKQIFEDIADHKNSTIQILVDVIEPTPLYVKDMESDFGSQNPLNTVTFTDVFTEEVYNYYGRDKNGTFLIGKKND